MGLEVIKVLKRDFNRAWREIKGFLGVEYRVALVVYSMAGFEDVQVWFWMLDRLPLIVKLR